jgi:glycine cleavage system H protein
VTGPQCSASVPEPTAKESFMAPDDRKYAETHEWVKLEGETAVVGITDHAQEQLGDITYVELPEIGSKMDPEAECAVIESVKAASPVHAPIAGEVADVNGSLEDKPEKVNESPYEEGWIFTLKGVDPARLEGLLTSDEYEASLKR